MVRTEEIKRQLAELTEELRALRAAINRNYLPRAEAVRQRRRAAAVLLAALVLLLVTGWVTQRVTLHREHQIVTACFLRPARLPPADRARCAATFGQFYADLQAQSAQSQATFVELQRRVARLEAAQKGNR